MLDLLVNVLKNYNQIYEIVLQKIQIVNNLRNS
jgi:hypothetical protein